MQRVRKTAVLSSHVRVERNPPPDIETHKQPPPLGNKRPNPIKLQTASGGASKAALALPVKDALEAVLRQALGGDGGGEGKPRKFVETVDMAIQLGVDPRKPNQSVRGVQALPHGTGKSVRVAVFAKGDVRAHLKKLKGEGGVVVFILYILI